MCVANDRLLRFLAKCFRPIDRLPAKLLIPGSCDGVKPSGNNENPQPKSWTCLPMLMQLGVPPGARIAS